jgi:hypothetical protein
MNGHSLNGHPSTDHKTSHMNRNKGGVQPQNGKTEINTNASISNGIKHKTKIEKWVDECNNSQIATLDTNSDTNHEPKSPLNITSDITSSASCHPSDINSVSNTSADIKSVSNSKSDVNSPSTVTLDTSPALNMTDASTPIKPTINGLLELNENADLNGLKRIYYGSRRRKNGRVLCLKMAAITRNRPKLRRHMLEVRGRLMY